MVAAVVQVKSNGITTGSSLSVTLDAAPTKGNTLLAFLTGGSLPTSRVWPDGWTEQDTQATNDPRLAWASKIVSSGDGTGVAVSFDATDRIGLVVVEVVGEVNAFDAGAMPAYTLPSVALIGSPPSIAVLAVVGYHQAFALVSGPTGYTLQDERVIQNPAASDSTRQLVWSKVVSSPSGSYGGETVDIGGASASAAVVLLGDTPAPGLYVGSAPIFTDRATSWRITRGASAEITGGASVGQATVTVRNLDNAFNPENSGSSIAADLVDGSPLWIGVDSNGKMAGTAVYGLFGGYLTDVTPIAVPGPTYPPTVELRAEDVLGRLSRTKVSLALSRTRSHGDLREAVLDEMGITTRTLANEIETMPVSGADGFALSVLEDLNRSTGTRHFIQPGDSAGAWYTYIARDRQWHLSGTAQGTITAGMTGVDPPSGWRRSADTVINQQRVTFTPISFTPATVTVWEADVLPLTLEATSREYWVQFDAFVDSPAVDLVYSGATVTSSLTAFGDTARLVVSTAGTATISRLEIEGSLARRAPDQSYVADDAVSQDLPRGIRSGSDISGDYVGTLASARGLAEHVVWRYTNPQVRPTITVTNWLPQQFDLDLFDLIAFSSTQLGVTSRLFEIVGLTHEGRHAATDTVEHVTTYVLQECRVQSETNWFTLDTHAPDGSAITGY